VVSEKKMKMFFSENAEQISTKLARNVHWMVLYQICVFDADLKFNMAARVHNVFSLGKAFYENKSLTCSVSKAL
jgi:hypothetical protein